MSPIDVFTVCSFIGVILCGVMALVVMDMRHKQPDARIKTRMRESFLVHMTRENSTVNVNSTCSRSIKPTTYLAAGFGPSFRGYALSPVPMASTSLLQ